MITLTASAIDRVRKMIESKNNVVGLRIGVTESGCSGYSYALDFAETVSAADIVIEQDGVKVVVDDNSMPMLEDMELDFVSEGLNQSFKFNNPNAISSCGCGESFSVTK
jgi:iron-sulfur cluster assembly protein